MENFFLSILKNLPDGAALGLVWGIMAIGVYITFKIPDIPDMTVDGTFALGGCMIAATVSSGWNPFVSTALAVVCGMVAGLVTGVLHTKLKIPAILAGILDYAGSVFYKSHDNGRQIQHRYVSVRRSESGYGAGPCFGIVWNGRENYQHRAGAYTGCRHHRSALLVLRNRDGKPHKSHGHKRGYGKGPGRQY